VCFNTAVMRKTGRKGVQKYRNTRRCDRGGGTWFTHSCQRFNKPMAEPGSAGFEWLLASDDIVIHSLFYRVVPDKRHECVQVASTHFIAGIRESGFMGIRAFELQRRRILCAVLRRARRDGGVNSVGIQDQKPSAVGTGNCMTFNTGGLRTTCLPRLPFIRFGWLLLHAYPGVR